MSLPIADSQHSVRTGEDEAADGLMILMTTDKGKAKLNDIEELQSTPAGLNPLLLKPS